MSEYVMLIKKQYAIELCYFIYNGQKCKVYEPKTVNKTKWKGKSENGNEIPSNPAPQLSRHFRL